MPDRGFKIVQEIGAIVVSPESEIHFSIDEFRGHRYGSVRRFLKSESYSGPTHSGVTFNHAILEGVIGVLKQLSKEEQSPADRELGRFAKRPGLAVVVRITTYRNNTGVDLREWQDDVAYKGWTKRGIRLPYEHLEKITSLLEKMKEALPKTGDVAE